MGQRASGTSVPGAVQPPALARRLGVSDAVLIGLGSMIGAGIFAAFAAGIVGCLVLVVTLPWQAVAGGVGMFAVGLLGRAMVVSRRSFPPETQRGVRSHASPALYRRRVPDAEPTTVAPQHGGAGDALPTGRPALVLVRHGETEWSRTGRHTGRSDIPLTDNGQVQAAAAGYVLQRVLGELRPSLVISSPRSRARSTAELAGYSVDLVTEDASEWDYGNYEGLTSAEIEAGDPGWSIWHGAVPGGESSEQISARIDRLLTTVHEHQAAGPVLIFSHGHASRCVAARWLHQPVSAGSGYWLGTGAVCSLGFEHERPAILHWNLDNSVAGPNR